MSFNFTDSDESVEITLRVTKQDYELLKYAVGSSYTGSIGEQSFTSTYNYESPEGLIRRLLHWELLTLQLCSGEVEKFRWKLLLAGKDPNVDLRVTNPELFVKSGGIVRDKKIPHFKPRFPALLTYDQPLLNRNF
jgi:hypothetical protein